MISMPDTIVDQEELIRAYWGTEILDSSSTIGAAWNITVLQPSNTSSFPCSDDLFSLPETLLQLFSFTEFETSSNFNHYLRLHHELFKVHALLQEPLHLTSEEDLIQHEARCTAIHEDLITWRERCDVATTPGPCYIAGLDGVPTFEPTVVIINATLNT
jgi:hypothetical protein